MLSLAYWAVLLLFRHIFGYCLEERSSRASLDDTTDEIYASISSSHAVPDEALGDAGEHPKTCSL